MGKHQDFDLGHVRALARRRCKDKQLLAVIVTALEHPDLRWARHTTSGILFAGPEGTVTTHFTGSDNRGVRNFISDLRKAGIYPANRKA